MTFATDTATTPGEWKPPAERRGSKLSDGALPARADIAPSESRNAGNHAQLLAGVAKVFGTSEIGGVHSLPPIRGPPNIHEDALLDRSETAAALTAHGYRTSPATLATKAVRGGGPVYCLFGRKPLYRWGDALKWANARLSRLVRNTSEAKILKADLDARIESRCRPAPGEAAV